MKIDPPKNANYCATVIKVQSLRPLEGLDNLVGLPVFGYQALVPKSTQVGDVGIIFPAEVQLSDAFAKANNLHRHKNLNENQEVAGYLEDTRRVKALKLRGHRSDALFMPLACLDYLDKSITLDVGTEFDAIDGGEICRKYVTKRRHSGGGGQRSDKRPSRVDNRAMPEHFETANFFKMRDRIHEDTRVVVTQKLHGTSIRIGNPLVARDLSWGERVARRLGITVRETEHAMVYGSRRVVKDPREAVQNHYYEADLWSMVGKQLDGLVPEDYVVYGEVIGWVAEGSPIQKGYTYNLEPGTRKLYVYRVAHVNPRGLVADLSWDGVKEFCEANGLAHVPELSRGTVGHVDKLLDQVLDDRLSEYFPGAVPLCKESPCDEGVCVRAEGVVPKIWKAKSPVFLQFETKALDKGSENLEEAA